MDSSFSDPADIAASRGATPETRRDKLSRDIKYAGSLLSAYVKHDTRAGVGLILLKLAVTAATSFATLQFQTKYAAAMNALVDKDVGRFWSAMLTGSSFVLGLVAIVVIGVFSSYTLRMRMRTVYTTRISELWLKDNNFYHLQRDGKIDHPEQRIQEDIFIFCEMILVLVPAILGVTLNLVLFTNKLWELSPEVSLAGIGLPMTSRAMLPAVAYAMGIGITVITHLVGNSLTKAEVARQRLEASFRAEMGEVRENAEAIAMEKGATIERNRLAATFNLIRRNWWQYTIAHAKLDGLATMPTTLMLIAPMALCAPLVLKGQMKIGDISLVGASFMMVYAGVSVLAANYRNIAVLRSAVVRIRFFEAALNDRQVSGIAMEHGGANISARNLNIAYPNGKPMLNSLSLEIRPGDRFLVRGPSGAGKSTMLRAIAGLWPFGSGAVQMPADRKIGFLPQRSYMPVGTLADLLTYPEKSVAADHGAYAELLEALGLGELTSRLEEHNSWRHILSPGQQQRIAAIRVLLSKPDFLFLDEATSALDPHSEANLYTLINKKLPQSAIISVAHRRDVAQFHDGFLEIRGGNYTIGDLERENA